MSFSAVVESDPTTTPAPRNDSWSFRTRILVGVLLFAAGAATGVAAQWWLDHKYEYIAKRWGVVVPGKIYRSGQLTPKVLDRKVKAHGITTIVDFQLYDIRDALQQGEIYYAHTHGLAHHRFPLAGDGTGDLKSYADAVALIVECEKKNEPILVHCAAGTQRTGGAIAFYRLLIEQVDPRDVHDELKRYDWEPEEDDDLPRYLNANMAGLAQMLFERGILERVPDPLPQLPE